MSVAVDLDLWAGQQHFLRDTTYPEWGIVSGVGYGKSHLACIKHHLLCEINHRSRLSLFMAHKLDLLINNIIPLYMKVLDSFGYQYGRDYSVVRGQNPEIRYHGFEHTVLLRSASIQAIDGLVGFSCSHASIDEAGQCAETTPIEVSKRVRCSEADALQKLYYGTPEGVGNFFFRKFNSTEVERLGSTRFSRGLNGDKMVLHGWTQDNRHLPKHHIEDLKREFSWNENLAKAYLYGEFVPLYDSGAYDFDPAKHLGDCPLQADRGVYVPWDFNVTQGRAGGVSWVAMQEDAGDVLVVKENRRSSRTTFEACDGLIEALPVNEWRFREIVITGDASGFGRDTRSYGTDYDIIRQKLAEAGYQNFRIEAPRANPSVGLRIAAVNRLLSPNWHQSLIVDRSCAKTKDSLLQTTIDDTGRIIKPAGETHTHYGETVGYGVVKLRPIKKPWERGGADFAWA